ncbi:MAG: hypothetical protein ACRD8U_00800 [Pyrinomonadaceae bacterium]
MNTFTYRKRVFLSPVSTGFTSYVFAEVESSDGGEYRLGNYILILADCHRRVELEFFLGTARDRRQSLAKLDLLIEVLTAFRSALTREAQLIAEYERSDQRALANKIRMKKLSKRPET